MVIENFLQTLLADGTRMGYFTTHPIKDIPKSCCDSATTEVIAFDETKEKLMKEKGLSKPKSCDGLKIIPALGRIDFIEMKRFTKGHEHKKGNIKLNEEGIKKTVAGFKLSKKLIDSIDILEMLMGLNSFTNSPEARPYFVDTKKYFIVLIDVDSSKNAFELFAFNVDFLAQYSTSIENQIEKTLQTELMNMPTDICSNFQKPILKNCNQIDAYYNSL